MIHYSSAYVTLNEVLQQVVFTDVTDYDTTTDAEDAIANVSANTKAQYKDFIDEVSDSLYNNWWREFVPRIDTLTVYANSSQWRWTRLGSDYRFSLASIPNADLLSINSITLDGTLLDSSTYRLDVSDGYPAQAIVFDADNVTLPSTRSFTTSMVIIGTWGYHENPSNMWLNTDTVQNATQISASATSLTVVSGAAFSVYQYIKIEDEFLFITAITSNTLTVERGVNGSTAAIHANGTAIYRYKQTPSVAKEVTKMVIKAFKMRNGEDSVVAGDSFTNAKGAFENLPPKRWTIEGV
jgi:hypothetical protein